MTEIMNRIGDRINPIVVKEMRQAVNSKFVSYMLVLFLTIELIVTAVLIFNQLPSTHTDALNVGTGRELFKVLQGVLIVACMLLIPTTTGGRLASERSDVKVDLLFISTLTPRSIMAGKFLAATALATLIFSACAPFMTFAYLLRGLEISTILLTLLIDFLAVLLGIAFSLLLASIPVTLIFRIILGIFGLIVLSYLSAGTVILAVGYLEFGFTLDIETANFWLAFTGLVGAVIGIMGLMFVWATALISPPTSNRVFPVRLYALGLWLFVGLACAVWASRMERPLPMYFWGIFGTFLFAFHMLIASSERDEWGPRVRRKIPRAQLFRIPAFLFYSGSAGGFAFSVLGSALSIIGAYLWGAIFTDKFTFRTVEEEFLNIEFMLVGYTYCFCMTAVAVRRLLAGSAFKPSTTWLIALILFGLGSILPFIAEAALYPKRSFNYGNDTKWLFVTSPIVMMEDETSSTSHIELTITFLVVWGLVVTALNLNWIVRQIDKFRPLDEKRSDASEGGEI